MVVPTLYPARNLYDKDGTVCTRELSISSLSSCVCFALLSLFVPRPVATTRRNVDDIFSISPELRIIMVIQLVFIGDVKCMGFWGRICRRDWRYGEGDTSQSARQLIIDSSALHIIFGYVGRAHVEHELKSFPHRVSSGSVHLRLKVSGLLLHLWSA